MMFDIKIKEAFRIDLSQGKIPIGERVQLKKDELSGQHLKKIGDSISDAEDPETNKNIDTKEESPPELLATDDEKITFLLKLCQTQLAYGQCTIDAEEKTINAAIAMGYTATLIDIGPRCMHAAFDDTKQNFFLKTSRDIILCKLQDVSDLASYIAKEGNKTYTQLDVEAATAIMEEIIEEPLPYGWFIHDILFCWLCSMAAIAAFFGSYFDMLVVFIISVFVLGVHKLCVRFPMTLGQIELILVTAVSGLLTAISYRISNGRTDDTICNIPIIFLSPLLVYLPGSELIYGAYEVLHGQLVVGGARLVGCLIRSMVMACGLLIGWTIAGYNLMEDAVGEKGKNASFVPINKCTPFTQPQNIQPWWMVFAVWQLVMLIPVLANLNVRPRDIPAQYLITYLSLLVYGALNFALGEAVNQYLTNIIGLFVATNLACFREYITGKVSTPSIIPVLLPLAPGSVVVLSVLGIMQQRAHVIDLVASDSDVTSYLFLLGVTYSLGMFIAQSYWKPILLRKNVCSSILEKVQDGKKKHAAFGSTDPPLDAKGKKL